MARAKAAAVAVLVCWLGMGSAGCELIADFDRSKIPTDAGRLPDANTSFDAGLDAQVLDGSLDGELPFDGGDDAAPPLDDAGDDDAGDDDAGDDDAG